MSLDFVILFHTEKYIMLERHQQIFLLHLFNAVNAICHTVYLELIIEFYQKSIHNRDWRKSEP